MNLTDTTIFGAIWSVASRLGARIIGLVGTLIITRYLNPDVMGEVGVAVVVVMTSQYFSNLGFGQYIVVKTSDNPQGLFHAFAYNLILTIVTAAVLLGATSVLADWTETPTLHQYLPAMVLAMVLERISKIHESIALRDMRFALFSTVTGSSEFVYVGVSIAMAVLGFGGASIVWANVAQWGFRFVVFGVFIPMHTWMRPCRLSWKTTKDMLRYSLPLALANTLVVLEDWDRLIINRLFGTATHGVFGIAKRISAVPADNIGDAIADILLPSFAQMSREEARRSVTATCHVVALILYPLTAGLAVVAPNITEVFFPPEWQAVAVPLMILTAVTLIDPIADTFFAFLTGRGNPMSVLLIQFIYTGVLWLSVLGLGMEYGLEGACVGVGVGMFVRAALALLFVRRHHQVFVLPVVVGLARCAAAAGVMVFSVLVIRWTLTEQLDSRLLALAIECFTGAIVYVPAVFLLARPIALSVIAWIRNRNRD